jgi:acyl-CoA thioesterase
MPVVPCGYPARAVRDGRVIAESTHALIEERPDALPRLHFPVADVAEGAPAVPGEPGHVRFEDDDVLLEVIDTVDGEDARDCSVKRFPHWGDAAHLIAMLDVQPSGADTFVGAARADARRPVVEASQMLGQAMVAAARHAPGRRVTSAQLAIYRAADARQELDLTLEDLSTGRTFSTVLVTVSQGRPCATVLVQMHAGADDVVRHAVEAPPCKGPYDSEPCDMGVTGRDIRVADGAYSNDSAAPTGPPVIDAWFRFRAVPDDPALHAALLAQPTGHMPIAAALRPHAGIGQDQAHRTVSMGINAISLSMHADVRADQWMRYHHRSTYAGDGMTHAECRVYDEPGRLLASFTVEAMVRPFAPTMGAVDERTAL